MAELDDIINTLIAEAYAEGPEGMRRVGETILNRAAIRNLSPGEVVRQPSQYTGYFAPGPAAVEAQKNPTARAAAQAAWELARQAGDPTNGADHYYNPSIVNPGWQNSMQHTGDFGGHTYYSSRTVPAEALASLLVPETRNVPLPRTRPTSLMEQMAQLFGVSFDNSGQRQDTAAGLDDYIQRQQAKTIAPNDMVFGTGFNDTFANAGAKTAQTSMGGLAEALQKMLPPLTTGVRQSYAAQDAIPAPSLFNGDNRGEWVEGTVIPLRTPDSGVGQPPKTRTVPSIAVTGPAETEIIRGPQTQDGVGRMPTSDGIARMFGTSKTPLTVGAPPAYAGMEGAKKSYSDPVGRMPAFSDIAMVFGNTPYATGSVNNRKGNEQLTPEDTAFTVSSKEVANPEYQRLLDQIARGEAEMRGVSPSGRPRSRDSFEASKSSAASIEALRRTLASTPKTITQQVRMPTSGPAARAPVARAPAAPLRITVKADPPRINPANHNAEQLRAAQEGRSTYTPAGGGPSMPVYSMNGKLRNTYGDSGGGSNGGSLL